MISRNHQIGTSGGLRGNLARLVAVTVVLWSLVGPVVGQSVPEFRDVPEGHIAEDAIEWAAANGITMGVGNNRFGMGQTLTRYEMVTFLCRAFDSGSCGGGTRGSERFVDVPVGHWADYPVGWAVARGITAGVSAAEFGGSRTLTREEMVTFLYRARGSPTGGGLGSDVFGDVPHDSSEWANLPIGWAFEHGITGGIADGVFGFGTSLSREEMVLFLCRAVAPSVCVPSWVPIPAGGPPATSELDPTYCDFTDHVARVSEAVYQVHTDTGIGTAFYIGNNEWLTAAHVVGSQVTVTLRRGSASLTARVVGTDFTKDLVLLEAPGDNLSPLRFGRLSEIGPGHQLFSVGYPWYVASQPSVTSGVLSRIESRIDLGTVVVTDTALSPGNSGGPLLNRCGAVIGLVVQKISDERVEGISFAVAETIVKQHLPVLRGGGSQREPDLTVSVGDWVYFTGENSDGTFEGYALTASDHAALVGNPGSDVGYSWEWAPELFLRCGVSNDRHDALVIGTDWPYIFSIDMIVEYIVTGMETAIAEWWEGDDRVQRRFVWADTTTELVTHLHNAGSGTLTLSIWDGVGEQWHWMSFEVEGIRRVLSDLDCW